MNISSASQAADTIAQNISPADFKRAQLQTSLLKKALENQQEQVAELMKMADGRGQNLDLRV